MRKPNLNALRAFDAAARLGSFQAASGELHVTQGAIAQQIRKLEADLGLPLFIRAARGVTLTETGAAYHHEISKALSLIDRATRALQPDTRIVTLSVPPSLASK